SPPERDGARQSTDDHRAGPRRLAGAMAIPLRAHATPRRDGHRTTGSRCHQPARTGTRGQDRLTHPPEKGGRRPLQGEGHSPGMVPMEVVAVIRHEVHAEGIPIREVARELGLSRNTIRRYARAKKVPIDRSPPTRPTPARDDVAKAAKEIWNSRRSFTAGKQRLTATRLWELL